MLDLRLIPAAVGAWLGALAAFTFDGAWAWLFFVPATALALIVIRPSFAFAISAIACAAGIGVAGLTISASRPAELAVATAERHTVTVVGRVASDPEQQRSTVGAVWASASLFEFKLNMESLTDSDRAMEVTAPILVRCDCVPEVGALVSMTGRIAPEVQYGEHIASLRADGPFEVLAEPGPVNAAANALRAGLTAAVADIDQDAAALIAGLSVGDETLQNQTLSDDMRRSGLSHLTAVSGGNVSIVIIMTLVAVSALGLGRRSRYVVVGLAILGFVILVRPQPSVLRAAVMGSVAVLGLFAGRPSRGISTLAVAVLGLILISPGLAASYGFALSTVATAGLLLLAPPLLAWFRRHRWFGRLPTPLVLALAATMAAQIATAPIIALMDAPIGSASVIANLLAAPAVAPVTIGGLAIAFLSVAVMPVAQALAHLVGLPAWWVAFVAHHGATWPLIPLPTGVLGAALWILVCVGIVVLPRRWLLALLAFALVVVFLAPLRRAGWPPPGWVLVACDVGQGDALVLRVENDAAAVIDAGPSAEAVDGCLDDLGVASVPLLVLTHFHADHVDGVAGVGEGRAIGQVVVSPIENPLPQAESVRRWESELGVSVHEAAPGERFTVGSTRWRVLWPRVASIDGNPNDDNPNNASVVLLVEAFGVRALLSGDVEPEAQASIVAAEGPIGVDVMKVPHHGSRYQYEGLIGWSGARIALVSVGAENSYGHPSPETLQAWQEAGAIVGRTDLDGDVAVVRDASGDLAVVSHGS